MSRWVVLTTTIVYGTSLSAAAQTEPRFAVGNKFGCVIQREHVVCFGEHGYEVEPAGHAVIIPNLAGAEQLCVGEEHACAVTNSGEVLCWGNGDDGRLGDNKDTFYEDRQTPVRVWQVDDAVSVACGERFGCAVRAGGAVSCWGDGRHGILGTARRSSVAPVTVEGLAKIVKITAGPKFACALDSDGREHCWGWNDRGELGRDSSELNRTPNPTSIQGAEGAVALAAADRFGCVLKENDAVWCWGDADHLAPRGMKTPTSGVWKLPGLDAPKTPASVRNGARPNPLDGFDPSTLDKFESVRVDEGHKDNAVTLLTSVGTSGPIPCRPQKKRVRVGQRLILTGANIPSFVVVQIGSADAKIVHKSAKRLVVEVASPPQGPGKKKVLLSVPGRLVKCGEVRVLDAVN